MCLLQLWQKDKSGTEFRKHQTINSYQIAFRFDGGVMPSNDLSSGDTPNESSIVCWRRTFEIS